MAALDWKSPVRVLISALLGAAAAAFVAACSPSQANSDPQLAALMERIGQSEMGRSPEEADMLGLSQEAFGRPYGALLNDRSMAVAERTRATRLVFLRELEGIDRTTLSREAQRTFDATVFVMRASVAVEAHGYGLTTLGWTSPYLITFADGAFTDLVKFMTLHSPVRSRGDAEAWLTRLDHMDDAMRDERRGFEVDIDSGALPPRAIVQRTLAKAQQLTPVNAREHPLIIYFIEQLAQLPDIPEEEIANLTKRAADKVAGPIKDEYAALTQLLERTLAKAPAEPGVWRLPGGEAYYREALKLYTSTDLSPKQLHDAGVKLVAQISAQIEPMLVELGQVEGGTGGRLRTLAIDPAYLFPETPEGRAALIDALRERVKWAETAMGRMIIVGPKAKVEVREVPRISQDTSPGAYYKAAPLDGSRPPTYNINLRTTLDFPNWMLPTLSFHEAVPGHHIQAGLARERTDQLLINYLIASPAFTEGWAVYAEDLADELGAYQADKMARLGYLQSLLFRAARMVADTGLHSMKWTRAETIAYLETTTGLAHGDVEFEVDRYSIWPGQACAYMAGRETLKRLRASASQQLKGAFDVKAFHQAILGPGPRPLPVLEVDIADWIASQRPQPTAK